MSGPVYTGWPLKRGDIMDLCFGWFQEAYDDASVGGTVPADARQVGYALRRRTQLGDLLKIEYVATSPAGDCLLDKYIERINPAAAHWDIVRAPRGNLIQPNGETVPLGTLAVRSHLGYIGRTIDTALSDSFVVSDPFPSFGPGDDYGCAMYIEKAGFNAMLQRNGLPRRRDLAILSSQGFSVDAARTMLTWLAEERDHEPLVVHDFDLAGIGIWSKIEDEVPNAVDAGLRWVDIEAFRASGDLTWMAETVTYKFDPTDLLTEYGATADEIAFLVAGSRPGPGGKTEWYGRRVELNALVGAVFITWLEAVLDREGVTKVIPDEDTLTAAYRRAYALEKINAAIADAWPDIRDAATDMDVPDDLVSSVTDTLDETPRLTWRRAINDRVEADIEDESDDDD